MKMYIYAEFIGSVLVAVLATAVALASAFAGRAVQAIGYFVVAFAALELLARTSWKELRQQKRQRK